MSWLYLSVAIVFEVIATSALKASNGFNETVPSLICIGGYAISFYFFSLSLKILPVGIAYAIWSGVGIVLISLIGLIVFKQSIDMPAIIGIGMIISGVITINLFSNIIG